MRCGGGTHDVDVLVDSVLGKDKDEHAYAIRLFADPVAGTRYWGILTRYKFSSTHSSFSKRGKSLCVKLTG